MAAFSFAFADLLDPLTLTVFLTFLIQRQNFPARNDLLNPLDFTMASLVDSLEKIPGLKLLTPLPERTSNGDQPFDKCTR